MGQIGEQIFPPAQEPPLRGGWPMDAPAGAVACQSPKIAGILYVFQDFGAKTGGKYAAEMRPAIYSEVPKNSMPEKTSGRIRNT